MVVWYWEEKTCFHSSLDCHSFHIDMAIRRKICEKEGDKIGYKINGGEEDIF